MFLQGGGPPLPMAAPPMAAPPNAGAGAGIPPELQMALAGAEQEGSAIGQGIGQKFVTDMMDGLDSAEDYEQAINAIRGNELPLSERYDELGEIVGEEDAKETPESVLALVQPAIMMTEEGAMNSGIGNLMKDLTGDVPMEGGMEGGVGSLMAAGQPAEPPMGPPPMRPGPDPTALGPTLNGTPQGFAVGGAVNRFRGSPVVQNFQTGGLADLYKVQPTSAYYQQNLGELRDIIDTDEQRNLAKSQILFDIARRGLAFAGGVNPETGQRMTGSPVSQFATAASGLPKTIGEQMSAVRAQEQKLKLAAYQGAQAKRAAAIERATKTFKMGEGDVLYGIGPDGKFVERGRGADKWRKPDLYYHELSNGEFTPHFNINDKNGSEEALAAYRDKTGKTDAKIVNTFKVGTRPVPKALPRGLAAQLGYTLFDAMENGKEIPLRTPPFNMAEKGARKTAIDDVLKARGLTEKDMVPGSSRTHKVAVEPTPDTASPGTVGSKSYLMNQTLLTYNQDIMKNLQAAFKGAETPDEIKEVARVRAMMDKAATLAVAGYRDQEGQQITRGLTAQELSGFQLRRSILRKDPSEEDKERLALPGVISDHLTRLDAESRADRKVEAVEKNISGSADFPERMGADGTGVPDKAAVGSEVSAYIKAADLRAAHGGGWGAIKAIARLPGKIFNLDWSKKEAQAAAVFDTLYGTTRKAILGPVAGEKERDGINVAYAEEIKELQAQTEGWFTTSYDAAIHASNVRSIVAQALGHNISVYRVAKDGFNKKLMHKAFAKIQRLNQVYADWEWVAASLLADQYGLNQPQAAAKKGENIIIPKIKKKP